MSFAEIKEQLPSLSPGERFELASLLRDSVTFADIKERVARLNHEERLDLAALIQHLDLQEDPEYLAEMDRRMAAMDRGEKYTLADIERIVEERIRETK